MRVLIVDDEEPLRKLLQHWVEAEGATVIEAGTAEDGLALAQSEGAPAVALCDIRLGEGKDGLWLAEQLQVFVDAHPDCEVPIERLAPWRARLDAPDD